MGDVRTQVGGLRLHAPPPPEIALPPATEWAIRAMASGPDGASDSAPAAPTLNPSQVLWYRKHDPAARYSGEPLPFSSQQTAITPNHKSLFVFIPVTALQPGAQSFAQLNWAVDNIQSLHDVVALYAYLNQRMLEQYLKSVEFLERRHQFAVGIIKPTAENAEDEDGEYNTLSFSKPILTWTTIADKRHFGNQPYGDCDPILIAQRVRESPDAALGYLLGLHYEEPELIREPESENDANVLAPDSPGFTSPRAGQPAAAPAMAAAVVAPSPMHCETEEAPLLVLPPLEGVDTEPVADPGVVAVSQQQTELPPATAPEPEPVPEPVEGPVPMAIDPPPAARSRSSSSSPSPLSPPASPSPSSEAELPAQRRSDAHLRVRRLAMVVSALFEMNEHLANRGGRGRGRGRRGGGGSSPAAARGGSGRGTARGGGGRRCGSSGQTIGPGAAVSNISRATECSLNGNPLPFAHAVIENHFPSCRAFLTSLKKYAQHWLAGEYVDVAETSFTNSSLCYIDDPSFPLCLPDLFSLEKVLAANNNAAHIQGHLDYYYDLRFRNHPVDARGALRFPVPACTTLIPPEDFLLDNLYKYAFPHDHDIIAQSHPRVIALVERMRKARFFSQLRAAQQVHCRLIWEAGCRAIEEESQRLAILRQSTTAESDNDVAALLALANSYDTNIHSSRTDSTSSDPSASPATLPAGAATADPAAAPAAAAPVVVPAAHAAPVTTMNDDLLGAPAAPALERMCRSDADRVFIRASAREQALVNEKGQCIGDANCSLHKEHTTLAFRRAQKWMRALHISDIADLGTPEQIRELSSVKDPTNMNPRIQLAKLVHAVHASIPIYAREIVQMSAAPVTQDRAELTPKELFRRNMARRQRVATQVNAQRRILETALAAKMTKLRAQVELDNPPLMAEYENPTSTAAAESRSSNGTSSSPISGREKTQQHLLLSPCSRQVRELMDQTFASGTRATKPAPSLMDSDDEMEKEQDAHGDDHSSSSRSSDLLIPDLDWSTSSVEQRQAAVEEQHTKWKAQLEEKVERINALLMTSFKQYALREFMVMLHTGRYPLSFQSTMEWVRARSSLAELRKRQLRTQAEAEEKAQRTAAQTDVPVTTATATLATGDPPPLLDEFDDSTATSSNGSDTGSNSKPLTARQQLEQLRNPFSFIRKRKYTNLSFFGEMVANMLLSCEFYWRICHNHGTFLMLWFGVKDAMLAASTHENFILLGDAAKGKSFMLKMLEHLSLKHGTSLVGRLSRFANSSEDDPIRPTRKGVVEMHEEAGVTFLNMQQDHRTTSHSMNTAVATGERSKRCDLPSEQVQALLNEMTSSENTTRRLMFDPNINDFKQQVVTVETQKVYIFCANARPNQIYEPLASRCHIVQVAASDRQNADIPGKQSESELTPTFRAKRDKERTLWHRDYAFTYIICMLIDCGIFAPVSLDNAEMLFRMVLLKLKQMGVVTGEETRTNIRMKRFAALVAIARAVRSYCDMPESPFGQSTGEFAFDQLLPIEAALTCTEEEAIYSITNFADCFENENRYYVEREIWNLMTENDTIPPLDFEPCEACADKLSQDQRLYASRALRPCADCNEHLYYSTIGFTNFDDVKRVAGVGIKSADDQANGTAYDVIVKQLHTALRNIMSLEQLREIVTQMSIQHEYASDAIRHAVEQRCREMRKANRRATPSVAHHQSQSSKRPWPASQGATAATEKRIRQEMSTSVSSSAPAAEAHQQLSGRAVAENNAEELWDESETPLARELREHAEREEDIRNAERAFNQLALEGATEGTTTHNIKLARYALLHAKRVGQHLFGIALAKSVKEHMCKSRMSAAIKQVCQHKHTEPGQWITGRTHRSQPYISRLLNIKRDQSNVLSVSSTNFASETQRFVLSDVADQREGNMADAFTASPTIVIDENMDDRAAERRRKQIGFTSEMIDHAKVVLPKQLRELHATGTTAFEHAKAELMQRVNNGEFDVERTVLPGDDEDVAKVKRELEVNRLLRQHYGDHLLVNYPQGITGWDTVAQSGYQRMQDAEADGFQFTLPLSDDENEEDHRETAPAPPAADDSETMTAGIPELPSCTCPEGSERMD